MTFPQAVPLTPVDGEGGHLVLILHSLQVFNSQFPITEASLLAVQ